MKYRQYSILRY